MVRAPCCEKMGLKKGPWTPEEDQILISYIQKYGHGNWRALPKQAGLLRCGKSCRLRWTNYLRPDIKRGNFSKEEEDTIIKLHEMLGNRWSAIAARLPGRTDNEIKNVWHTHLKKKLKQNQPNSKIKIQSFPETFKCDAVNHPTHLMKLENQGFAPVSPQQSCSEFSSVVTSENLNMDSSVTVSEIDESFWSETLSSSKNSSMPADYPAIVTDPELQFQCSSISTLEPICSYGFSNEDLGFWYNPFLDAGDSLELPGY
ncbi:hypothetical protein NE237_015361 [Protea cynaroides]|uniref:Uncharacterized protein n=1 Tax=Protea cynaroides TaxID=273540 RepID=A0A9Q0KDX2_9MAGN|nr:hypothetical protein NE237_015361 [Protea cynaroides]